MNAKMFAILTLLALVGPYFLANPDGAAATNPIKLFAPWSPGYKWSANGFYFNPPSHNGVDFNGVYDINGSYVRDDNGEPVVAAQDGVVVVAADENDNYGIKVDIHHGGNVYTRYAHLQSGSLAVSVGSRVLHGQRLGSNGCTGGTCTAPHIHFEVRTGGRWGTPELPTPFDGASMAQGQLFLSHNFQERLEVGYRDAHLGATGDQWPDIGAYHPETGNWWVAYNTGTSSAFSSQGAWLTGWAADAVAGQYRQLTGDFGGDGDTDIAVYEKALGRWYVAFNNGGVFYPAAQNWLDNWAVETAANQWRPFVGDFNDDNLDDIAVYHPVAGDWWVAFSTGYSFTPQARWLTNWAKEAQDRYWQNLVGDVDLDGDDDIVAYDPRAGKWWVAYATGSAFVDTKGSPWISSWAVDAQPGDYLGLIGDFRKVDGKADIAAYRPALGRWFVAQNNHPTLTYTQYNGPGPYGSWIDNWAKETGAERWRPYVGDFAGIAASEVADIGAYSAELGRWFVADNKGTYFQQSGGIWLDNWANESYPGEWRTY